METMHYTVPNLVEGAILIPFLLIMTDHFLLTVETKAGQICLDEIREGEILA